MRIYVIWYFDKFLVDDTVAAMVEWQWALHHVGWGESKTSKPRKNHWTCNVGKELISYGEKFVVFLPPGSKELAAAYGYLRASGITERWYLLLAAGSGSKFALRAQEWIRVKGKTTIVDIGGNVFEPQRLLGKVKTVFLLWVIGILGSGGRFLLEFLLHIFSSSCGQGSSPYTNKIVFVTSRSMMRKY